MTTKRRALGRGLAALIPAAGRGGTGSDGNGVTPYPPAGLPGPEQHQQPQPQPPPLSPAGGGMAARILDAGDVVRRDSAAGRPSAEAREGLRVVGIEEVHPARSQPRKTFDDAKLDELATSIRSQGLIQPVVARVREAGGYEIIAGERRWRAAQRAGMHTIPVVVREIAPARAFELAMVENLQREDLNPIEEAEGFDRLIQEFGYTQESLAARVGKDRTSITNALRLLKLPSGVRALVIAGRLSMGHARAILGLESISSEPHANGGEGSEGERSATGPEWSGTTRPDGARRSADIAERMEHLARKVVAREMSVRAVEAMVRLEKRGRPPAPEKSEGGTSASSTTSGRDLANRLSRALGTRVRLVEAGPGRGHIEIPYSSLDDLDGLLAKLMP